MKLKEKCGICGIYGNKHASYLAYLALYALQHRGQESTGIVSTNGNEFFSKVELGKVPDVFGDVQKIGGLEGHHAIGHVRYSTAGDSDISNAQPLLIKNHNLCVAHNGNLINALEIKKNLEQEGCIFYTNSDTEVIPHLVVRSKEDTTEDRIIDALKKVKGAYSLVFMTKDKLIGARDPYGFRPLALGKKGNSYILVSETCALDIMDAKYIREVKPGELISISKNGIESREIDFSKIHKLCIFEYIYFSRPDSFIFGIPHSVQFYRKNFGKQLAIEHSIEADFVTPVPDSSNCGALGYAQQLGIPFDFGLIRNHYVDRTFIEPRQYIRSLKVKKKLNPVQDFIKGKRVVVEDDSIMRSNTIKSIVNMLRRAGAREVHVRIHSPPNKRPCHFGVDTPTYEELIASQKSVKEIEKIIGADSLRYLSLGGMLSCVKDTKENFCVACFNGEYPKFD